MNWLCMCNPPVIIITFTNSYPDHPLTPSPNIERRHFYHNPSSPFSTIWFPFSIIQYFSDTKDLKAIHTGLAREWQSIGVSFLILLLSSLCFLLKQENQSKYGLPWKLNLIYGKACDLGKWPPKGKVWLRAGSAFTEETMPARFLKSLRSYFLLSYQKVWRYGFKFYRQQVWSWQDTFKGKFKSTTNPDMGRVCQTWVWRSIRGWVTAFHDQQAPNMLGMRSSTGVFLVNFFILGLLLNIWNYIRQIDMVLRYQNTHIKMRPPLSYCV